MIATGGRAVEAADDVHHRGMSRAGRTHDCHVFAALDAQIDALQCGNFERTALVGLGDLREIEGKRTTHSAMLRSDQVTRRGTPDKDRTRTSRSLQRRS